MLCVALYFLHDDSMTLAMIFEILIILVKFDFEMVTSFHEESCFQFAFLSHGTIFFLIIPFFGIGFQRVIPFFNQQQIQTLQLIFFYLISLNFFRSLFHLDCSLIDIDSLLIILHLIN